MDITQAQQIVQKRDDIVAQLKALKTEFVAASQVVFKQQAKGLFEQFPTLEAFSWTQYTPYFNDGDSCEFSVRNDEPLTKFAGQDKLQHNYYSTKKFVIDTDSAPDKYGRQHHKYVEVELTDEQRAANATGAAVNAFLRQFDEEQYKDMFGDHAQITVTKEGIDVDSYDHD